MLGEHFERLSFAEAEIAQPAGIHICRVVAAGVFDRLLRLVFEPPLSSLLAARAVELDDGQRRFGITLFRHLRHGENPLGHIRKFDLVRAAAWEPRILTARDVRGAGTDYV